MQPPLAIAIPTYQRAVHLDKCLSNLIPIAKTRTIPIYVYDNASTDRTFDVVKEHQQTYDKLFYSKNSENLGMDGNYERCLIISQADYVWLFGDSYFTTQKTLENILEKITQSKPHFVFLNYHGIGPKRDRYYCDFDSAITDLVVVSTCVSTLIYEKESIKSLNFKKYYGTGFSLCGVIFDLIQRESKRIDYLSATGLDLIEKRPNWSHGSGFFKIGIDGWVSYMNKLLPGESQLKTRCLPRFARESGMVTIKGLLRRRSFGVFDLQEVYKNRKNIVLVGGVLLLIKMCLISLIPKNVLRKLDREMIS